MTSPRFSLKSPFWVITILILVFGVPLIFAWLLNQEHTSLGRGTTNTGQLILPPLDFNKLSLQNANPAITDVNAWQGHWLLVYVNPQACEEVCKKNLYYLRQIRTATGKESNRVQRVLISFSKQRNESDLTKLLATDYAGTLYFTTSARKFNDFTATNPAAKLALPTGSIYLVDPLGNMLMTYSTPIANPMGIFKDLTRLLKLSHIG